MSESKKNYTAADLRILDPIEGILMRPDMYISPDKDPRKMAAQIAEEAFILTKGPVYLNRIDEWYIIAAENDWLANPKCFEGEPEIQKLFRSIIAFPEWGDNSMYGEVLLTVFAQQVVTWLSGERTIIKGDETEIDELERVVNDHPEWKRVVAFREFGKLDQE
ncbi:MAG: hypothetical protein KDA65_03205 [Planctomycetaceae bacterium]|nr:hypothetical protein [Planctomycetaceae bacterium]